MESFFHTYKSEMYYTEKFDGIEGFKMKNIFVFIIRKDYTRVWAMWVQQIMQNQNRQVSIYNGEDH